MNNLVVRVLFALVGIPVFIYLLWGGEWTHLALMTALVSGGMWEFTRMMNSKYFLKGALTLFPLLAGAAGILMERTHFLPFVVLLWGVGFLLLLGMAFNQKKVAEIMPTIAFHGFGYFFFGIWFQFSWPLLSSEQGFEAVYPFLFVATSMWVCDSGAYFVGKFFGKKKLCPEISPKKTIEGALGGGIFTIAWAYFMGPILLETSLMVVLAAGVLLSVTAPLGDLLFSCLKRFTGTKDSSKIFPGHGGFVDRFDSLYLSAPLFSLLLVSMKDYQW